MKIVVLVKMIPDLVEELTIDASGKALDLEFSPLIINEFDQHAIEQGLLLKEKYGGELIVIAPDVEGAEDVLFTAAASGADRLIRLIGLVETVNNHAWGSGCAQLVKELEPTLVLTGVQAHNDLDGQLGSILAEYMGIPFVGYISGLALENGKAILSKEYPGGLIAKLEVGLPAVIGIQAAEQPPRYVAFSRVRQAMKISVIEDLPFSEVEASGDLKITRMYQPELDQRAEMITGEADEIASKLLEIFRERSIV